MATRPSADVSDPFGTIEIRRRVLAGWKDSPARFREDANTEEDFGLGGYRDRLVVELAQNAADAAVRADVPGRLRLTLTPDALLAANTGEPLTAPGVQALATLRASHKPDRTAEDASARAAGSVASTGVVANGVGLGGGESGAAPAVVGRFGVGFAAVLAVTDEPEVHSRTGGVRFSRQDTVVEVSDIPELAAELSRRSGHVPVLRLPYSLAMDSSLAVDGSLPASGPSIVPDGFDTVVRLPFRDQAGYVIARRALLAVDDALLLALPALHSIEIDLGDGESASAPGADDAWVSGGGAGHRVLADVEDRWQVFRAGGFWTEEERGALLADRPTEERDRASWTVTWALPRERARSASALSDVLPDALPDALLDVDPLAGAVSAPGTASGVSGTDGAGTESGTGTSGTGVLHAPTPTDETLSLPALLIASFPLDPNRRRVQPGPLTDRLVVEAARAYAELLTTRAREANRVTGTNRETAVDTGGVRSDVLSMVPTGLPVSEFDAALSEAIRTLLPRVPLLPPVRSADVDEGSTETDGLHQEGGSAEPPALLAGAEAVAVDGLDERAAQVLASVVPNLVRPRLVTGAAGRTVSPAVLNVLGVRRVGLADVVEELAGVAETRAPEWWRRLYDACADLVGDPLAAEALGALPVPLADGRTVHGPRGVLLPSGEVPADSLAVLVAYGMRVAHPDASSSTLERLGARPADPATLLADSATRAAVRSAADASRFDRGSDGISGSAGPDHEDHPNSEDGTDGAAVVDAILRLVRSAGAALRPGTLPWLGELPLPDTDGELVPAASLVLPGSPAERLLDPDEFSVLRSGLVDHWGTEALRAVGVLESLGVLWAEDVDLASLPDDVLDLPDVEDWADERLDAVPEPPGGATLDRPRSGRSLPDEPLLGELVAIRDLDLVDPDAWRDALRLIGSDPDLRRTLFVEPSYTAWWIAGRLGSVGTADPDADPDLAGLLPPAPPEVAEQDPRVRERLGTRRSLRDLDRSDIPAVLDALADPARTSAGDAGHPPGVDGEGRADARDPYAGLDASSLVRIWRRLARLADRLEPARLPEAPEQVRVLDGAGTRLVIDAVVVDSPVWLQLEEVFGDTGMVAAPPGAAPALAAVFDLPTIRDVLSDLMPDARLAGGAVVPDEPGAREVVPAAARRILPAAPEFWYEHDEVLVAGHPVDWWVDADGLPHAATTDGLARGLAWAAGPEHWPARHVLAAVLSDPDSAHTMLPESAFD